MAPQVGFEPTTDRLTADSSTTELLRNINMVGLNGLEPSTSRLSGVRSNQLSYRPKMERVMGIEPTTSAWKAGVLPLNYTRISYFNGATSGNRTHECQSHNLVR
ncbi:conserved hypothetical protein [Candidatus Methylacidithermus pantelleriae]|uniref:Uncharacterized protein n=1 Tax=Candidatus Methylacidithermus pantelleriae TaxID=2744239 RepID=A0A8J2BND2_9BACT|nr:conserved hypothetical protein [Candidatus Methylacidithermus pantelleriae]